MSILVPASRPWFPDCGRTVLGIVGAAGPDCLVGLNAPSASREAPQKAAVCPVWSVLQVRSVFAASARVRPLLLGVQRRRGGAVNLRPVRHVTAGERCLRAGWDLRSRKNILRAKSAPRVALYGGMTSANPPTDDSRAGVRSPA